MPLPLSVRTLSRFSFTALYIAALGVSILFLTDKLNGIERDLQTQHMEALNAVRDNLGANATRAYAFVDLMQLTMQNEMTTRPRTGPPSTLRASLQAGEKDGKASYNLDHLPPQISQNDVGNLTGFGALADIDPELAVEMEAALTLRATFREILTELPNVPWAYYVSVNRFLHMYPWRPSEEVAYADEDLDQEYVVKGAPAANPQRDVYVTDVYDDDGGQGLMITIGRPVYYDNTFKGVVALDFQLHDLDDILSAYPKAYGDLYLIDADRSVIGFSRRTDPAQKITLPAALLTTAILDADAVGMTPTAADVGGDKVIAQAAPVLPFTLVAVTPARAFYARMARGAMPEMLTVLIFIGLLTFTEWRRRISNRLRQANAELAAAKEQAEDATRAKSSFLAMMSHEIRTPMNGVMSMAEMLDQTELTADQRSMSAVIRTSAASLLAIINDILDFSKIEAGKLDIESTPFSLTELIEGVTEIVNPKAEEKGLVLAVVMDPQMDGWFTGDPTRIRQILINLLSNAIKFTETGHVILRVMPLKDREGLRFEVVDTGIGLTPQQQAKLFTAFAQADVSTSRKYGGTGLGLSISERLCTLMGGAIGVASHAGEGSTFWFELPLPPTEHKDETPVPVQDASVIAVGFEGPTRDSLDAILAHLGVTAVRHLTFDNDLVTAADTPHAVVLLSAHRGDQSALLTGQSLMEQGVRAPLVLVAPRTLASTLGHADRTGFLATVTLPLHRARVRQVIGAALGRVQLQDRRARDGAAVAYEPPPMDEARAAGAVILVAEDNATNQTVIKRILSRLGYAFDMADDGRAALGLYELGVHGLLLTDFHMPEMDGFALTAALRRGEEGTGRHLPIIALTADALPGTEQQCLQAGMDGYLTKPINIEKLAALLEAWCPAGMALRRTQRRGSGEAPPQPAPHPAHLWDVDPQIFDRKRLEEAFGVLDAEAAQFLATYIPDARQTVAAFAAAMTAEDWALARDHIHRLKGSARSAGATRLGQVAADIQDGLDGDDTDTAKLFAQGLSKTVDEFAQTVQPLITRMTAGGGIA